MLTDYLEFLKIKVKSLEKQLKRITSFSKEYNVNDVFGYELLKSTLS